ncbi:hypothetical protein HPB48_006881 [Haemaphysalis longicornis]|uniref:Cullin family profile domain-containing protein n=1 Tax=Haemaphysalis longicornis TaxID=44386 RepID=A0A9J6FF24_HAELO|nr:hypothetical protein HPB48_006881 [Haemaphysalis longicornis]
MNIYDAYQLAVVGWRDRVFKVLWADLTAVLLKLIEEQRNGESIDSDLVRLVLVRRGVFSYVEIGVNEDASCNLDNLMEYRAAFESLFLLETYSLYKNKSADFLSRNSVTDYIKDVEQRLDEENQRVNKYLHETTSKPLAHYCNRALIRDHHEIFRTEFEKLLHEDKVEDLKRIFWLVSCTEGGLRDLMAIFEEHVRAKGLSAGEKLGKRSAMDPELYFSAMLQVHSKCKKHVIEALNNNSMFIEALGKACISFVNTNAFTYLTKSPKKSPELLARYCNTLLIESAAIPEESGVEHLLGQSMVLFKYIKEKDVLKKLYAQLSAKRFT